MHPPAAGQNELCFPFPEWHENASSSRPTEENVPSKSSTVVPQDALTINVEASPQPVNIITVAQDSPPIQETASKTNPRPSTSAGVSSNMELDTPNGRGHKTPPCKRRRVDDRMDKLFNSAMEELHSRQDTFLKKQDEIIATFQHIGMISEIESDKAERGASIEKTLTSILQIDRERLEIDRKQLEVQKKNYECT